MTHRQEAQGAGHGTHLAGAGTRALVISGVLTGLYFLVELGVGFWTGSIAVISDAFHTFSAVGGVLVALVASHYARREATRFQTFGLLRAEIVGALFNGLFLVGMAVLVLWMGFMRLRNPIHLATTPMLIVATGGLITEIISLELLRHELKDDLNIKGAFWHVLQTFVGSLIIIVSALVIRFTGFLAIDPLLGMVFGLALIWASWTIIRGSLHVLLERTPEDLDLNAVMGRLTSISGVRDVHHLHAWSLTSDTNVLTAHVKVDDLREAARIQPVIHDMLQRDFGIYFSTIQLEERCLDERGAPEIDFMRAKEARR